MICNPAPFHIPVALALARAGSHLLIEKPLSDALVGISELIQVCQEAGVVALTGYNLRFLPSLNRFHELIRSAAAGPVLSVRMEVGQYLPGWRPGTDYRASVSARKALGGGVLLELSHELDYLRWIFGEVVWVQGTLSRQSSLEIDVEDTAHLTCGVASADGGRTLVASISLDFIRRDTTRVCTALCENGSLRWDGVAGIVSHYVPSAGQWQTVFHHVPARDDSYRAEWQHFLECISTGESPLISVEDGMKVMQIIAAAHKASDIGGLVRLPTAPDGNGNTL